MKEPEDHYPKKKAFLKKPYFPGGKTSFQLFIKENLEYPQEALKNRIEGTVFMEYIVDDLGNIGHINILRGVGYGCDEEATRLVRLMKYPPVRNRGIRITTTMKTRIQFKLPPEVKPVEPKQIRINYVAPPEEKAKTQQQKPKTLYSYQIKLK